MPVKSDWPTGNMRNPFHVGAHQDKVLHVEEGDDARIVHEQLLRLPIKGQTRLRVITWKVRGNRPCPGMCTAPI